MLAREGMPTLINNRSTVKSRDPMVNLEQELKIRNFSPKTIKAYLHCNRELLRFANKFSDDINKQDIKDYLEYLICIKKSTSTINLAINAFKFYYEKIMRRKFFSTDFGIVRPKKEKKLPVVLSKEEIVKMIKLAGNIKHKLVIQVLYSSGLRVGELVDLKINDIDFGRKNIHVFSGKGKKDRITIISEIVLKNIEKYLLDYKPLVYLFEGFQVGKKMNVRSFQKIVYYLSKKLILKKKLALTRYDIHLLLTIWRMV